MKHNPIILIVLLLGITLFGCKKYEQENITPKITEDKVETFATTAIFTWTVDWPGKLISVVEVSENEDMSHSQFYGLETETEDHDFLVTVTDLKEATRYYYRHIVWNKHYVDNKFEMEVKSFITEIDLPKVKTVEVTNVTRTTATVIGEVTDDCGAEVTERGVCWSTSHNPTVSDNHASDGIGLGTYSIEISNLLAEQTYYVRTYAVNSIGTAYGEEEQSFTTGDAVKPTVTTVEVTYIDWRTATGGGEVTDDGGATVTERGICWSTSHNPEVSGDHASDGIGIGNYTVNMTGLTAGTIYYVRAYAKNIAGLNYGNEVSFETKAPELPMVTTALVSQFNFTQATAVGGGEVTSDGGDAVTERGIYFGINPAPATNGTKLVASSVGTGSFTCTMTGLVEETTYYVCAYATNGQGTSFGSEKIFTYCPPIGTIIGIFSVSSSKKVFFSRGNLQYRASDGRWRFAEHQYDYIGNNNSSISSSNGNYIDLFGWGTSGWNSGAICYQPWSTSTSCSNYYPGGSYINDLTDNYANADWGVYNRIYNGGNAPNQWRTLTDEEWKYVFQDRNNASSKYGHGKVDGVCGMILLPDSWAIPSGLSFTNGNSNWANIYTAEQWDLMESNGAVFLPAAGGRSGTSVYNVGSHGAYWSVSHCQADNVGGMEFYSGYLLSPIDFLRCSGLSVRLVTPAE